MTIQLIDIIKVQNTLGEAVLWRNSDQTLWWTDIQECLLYQLDWSTQKLQKFLLPERLGSFGFIEGSDGQLVCAFESGFAFYAPESKQLDWITKPIELGKGRRLNDGRVGPDGCFWAGSMLEDNSNEVGETGLYCLDRNGQASLRVKGLHISNGITWSPDAKLMYFSDSVAREISQLSYKNGDIDHNNAEIFQRISDGAPDGAVTDENGGYWSAIWGAGCVRCFSIKGKQIGEIKLPALQPTCVAFGGPKSNLMFVTSAREGLNASALEKFPKSGNLFIFETSFRGSKTYRYQSAFNGP